MPLGSGALLQDRQLDRRQRDDPARGLADRLRGRIVGIGEDERRAGIGLHAQGHRQRHLAEQRDVDLVGERLTAALAEDREALARRGREAGHVLDDARDLQAHLARHLGGAAGDLLRRRLRRRDDDELRLRQELRERHRDVAGAGRQVDEQVVELAPGDVLEELRQGLVQHRPAPHDGGVLLYEEADRHDLHAVGLHRQDLALGGDRRALAAEAEHARDRVAPDVGVEDADTLALERQRGGEVARQRGLADATLARADAEDVGDLRERSGGQRAAAERLLELALLGVRQDVEGDVDLRDAVDRERLAGHGLDEVVADRAARGRQRDGDGEDAAVGDLDRADHAELDDRLVQLGVDDPLERGEDLVLGRHALQSRTACPAARRAARRFGAATTDAAPGDRARRRMLPYGAAIRRGR